MAIRTITVLGAGTMGHGIAHVAAFGGFAAVLHDVSADALGQARAKIQESLRKGVEKGKVAAGDAEAALARLRTETDFARAVAEADLVIEAIPEDIRLKIDVFRRLDSLCRPTALFATNTSALSITEMAAATKRPAQVVGMHFFNPVHIMKLVEVVRGLETSESSIQAVVDTARAMGKETVTLNESPGFITTRVNALIGNEAFTMLQEGVASKEDIDKALKLGLNHPMGPFELVDLVGLDTRLSILHYLHATLGEKYRPSPLLEKYVKAGRLGKKTGRGVYDYPAGK